jgi:hypothetical protein
MILNLYMIIKYIAFALLLFILLKYMPGLNLANDTIIKVVIGFTLFIFIVDLLVYSPEHMESIPCKPTLKMQMQYPPHEMHMQYPAMSHHHLNHHMNHHMEYPEMTHDMEHQMEHPEMKHTMEHPDMKHHMKHSIMKHLTEYPEIKYPHMNSPEDNEDGKNCNCFSHIRFRKNHPLSTLVHSCNNPYINLEPENPLNYMRPMHHMHNKLKMHHMGHKPHHMKYPESDLQLMQSPSGCDNDYMIPRSYDEDAVNQDYMKTGMHYDNDQPYYQEMKHSLHNRHRNGIVPFSKAPQVICQSKLNTLYRSYDPSYNIWSPHQFSGKNRGPLNWDTTYA